MSDMMLGLDYEGFSQVKEICLYLLGVCSLELKKQYKFTKYDDQSITREMELWSTCPLMKGGD